MIETIEKIVGRIPFTEVHKSKRRRSVMINHERLHDSNPEVWNEKNKLGLRFIEVTEDLYSNYPDEPDLNAIEISTHNFLILGELKHSELELINFALVGSASVLSEIHKDIDGLPDPNSKAGQRYYPLRKAHQALSEYFETL